MAEPDLTDSGVVDRVDIQDIVQMIPHRPPFLMIDRVIDIHPDEKATGIKNVTIDEPFFQGHFPGEPVMPGVLLIESMAQTACVLVVKTDPAMAGKIVFFMTVEKARFRRPVVPGDQVHLQIVKERNRGNYWRFTGEARVDGQVMAEATFSAMIMDR